MFDQQSPHLPEVEILVTLTSNSHLQDIFLYDCLIFVLYLFDFLVVVAFLVVAFDYLAIAL